MKIDTVQTKTWLYTFKLKDGTIYKTNLMIIGKIINRMKKKLSPIILICGGQRMGKSFVAVWLAYKILKIFHSDRLFDLNRHTFYDPIDAIKNLQDKEKEPLIIDEAGAYLNKTDWYKKIIKAFDKIIQTQGYKCNCYIFISPFGSDIAKTFRKHFDFIIHVRSRGLLKVKQIPKKYDDMSGKFVWPYFLENIKIPKNAIPKSTWENYEKYSIEMKEELRKKLIQEEHGEKDPFGRIIRGQHEQKRSV